jgi:hypothetical protein
MATFIETFKAGKTGKNFGLTTGIKALDKAINRIQRKTTIGLAAAPKCGKTTLCDFSFLIQPYLEALQNNYLDNIEWIYFSYEIDRVNKEFKFAAFFMAHDHQQYTFEHLGKTYGMNADYLMGKQVYEKEDGTTELIRVSEEHEALLQKIYYDRIVPLFGEYDAKGIQLKPGKIIFIEEPENPTGLNKFLVHYAKEHGRFLTEKYITLNDQGNKVERERVVGYVPKNEEKFTIVITDHIRKLRRERGFTMKENIDKWLEYSTILRNLCSFTFIHVVHSGRQLANMERLRYAGEFIFPTADDTKDSGNVAEECSILMTLFNPNDEKYNLQKHFGVDLAGYPNYRSIHITESRNTECPVHIQVNMYGGINLFTPLNST